MLNKLRDLILPEPSHFSPKDIKRLFIFGISADAYFYSKFPLHTVLKIQKLINGCYVDDTNSFKTLINKEITAYDTKLKKVKVKPMPKTQKLFL